MPKCSGAGMLIILGALASSGAWARITCLGATGAGAGAGAGVGAGASAQNCNAKTLEVIVQGQEHRFGFDGRQVALGIQIPIQNICQQVDASCADTCAQAAQAAEGVRGFSGPPNPAQLKAMGEAADAFNAALGNPTNFATDPIIQN